MRRLCRELMKTKGGEKTHGSFRNLFDRERETVKLRDWGIGKAVDAPCDAAKLAGAAESVQLLPRYASSGEISGADDPLRTGQYQDFVGDAEHDVNLR